MLTSSWYAEFALRRRVSMSATGSVIVMWARALPRRGFPATGGDLRRRGSVCLEREAEVAQECTSLVVRLGSRHDRDVHTADPIDPVLVDLMEHRLLRETEGVVAVPVELAVRQSAEIADAGQRERHDAVDELPHTGSAHRDVRTDRLLLAQLELRDGLPSPCDDGLLARDERQIVDRALDELRVARRIADTHVHDGLHQAGDLHGVGVGELLLQLRHDLIAIDLLEARGRAGVSGLSHQMSSPVRRETRTRTVRERPSRSTVSSR